MQMDYFFFGFQNYPINSKQQRKQPAKNFLNRSIGFSNQTETILLFESLSVGTV